MSEQTQAKKPKKKKVKNPKKNSIIYILKVLQKYSDEEHFLTYEDIIKKMKDEGGPAMSRKAIGTSIDLIGKAGYKILHRKPGGTALSVSSNYNRGEVNFLIDAVFSSKIIPADEALRLAQKLSNELPESQRGTFQYLYKAPSIIRTPIADTLNNIKIISQAIGEGRKISFRYVDYEGPTSVKVRYNGYLYKANPYYIVNMRNDYYLILNFDKREDGTIFHIGRMKDITIMDEPSRDIHNVKKLCGFDISKFLNDHVYPFLNYETVEAKVILNGEKGIHYAVEWFGTNVRDITKIDDKHSSAFIHNDRGSITYFCLQYPDNVKAVWPPILMDDIQAEVEQLNKNYPGKSKN